MKPLHHTLAVFCILICGCASTPPAAPASPAASQQPAPLKGISHADPVYGYVADMRADLSRGKVEIINDVMQLTTEENKTFWPIYQNYETELFALGDQRLELIRKFAEAQEARQLDNAKAAELTDGYFQFETARIELVKKYSAQISKELSPIRAAQFTQIEHRVGTVIDLLIASELPLIHHGMNRPTTAPAK